MLKAVQQATLASAMLVAAHVPTAAYAVPVSFQVESAQVFFESGYGGGNDRLAVAFLPEAVSPSWTALLQNVGDSFSFRFGSAQLNEEGNASNASISADTRGSNNETDGLGVQVHFSFVGPFAALTPVSLTGTAVATPGVLSDAAVDYALSFEPVVVPFGAGGAFELSVAPLSFIADEQLAEQWASVKLTALPVVSAVPEPSSFALASLGMLAVAGYRLREQKSRT